VHFRYLGHANVPLIETPLGPAPEGWEVKPVTEAVAFNPTVKVPREGEKPFVPMSSLSTNSMVIADIELRTGNSGSKFQNGDTLFARITPCLENGKTGYVRFLCTDLAVAFGSTEFIVMRSRSVCPEFVYLLARSDSFRDHAIKSMTGATGRQRVQEASLLSFLIAAPPRCILDEFRSAAMPLFAQVHVLSRANDALRRTRDLLLPKLVAGVVDVTRLVEDAALAARVG
jgi:type I restriction enzyme, S subunit